MQLLRFALAGGLFVASTAHAAVTLTHVHGLAYSHDGKQLMLPSHHGLAVYENGKWSIASGPQHDYMGFTASSKNLYSSGHPAPGSGMVNPFGLIRSKDGGKTWDKLGLEGESDFHLMAASWDTGAIYAWNPAPSSRMSPGLHYTLDDGSTWKHARARMLEGTPQAIAVHPADPKIVAVATSSGVFISRDSGERFEPLARGAQGLSVCFDLDGTHLWYGTFDGQPRLAQVRLGVGKPQDVELPPLGRDAVAYIAQNPARRSEYAIATFERSVYVSSDSGRSWKQIAQHGSAQ